MRKPFVTSLQCSNKHWTTHSMKVTICLCKTQPLTWFYFHTITNLRNAFVFLLLLSAESTKQFEMRTEDVAQQ